MSTSLRTINALGFAMDEAIVAGDADHLLHRLKQACINRERLLSDPTKQPVRTEDMVLRSQHWVWLQGAPKPHWEIRGTGARV